MADFEYKDLDGDALQVVAMNYPASNQPGWLFRAIPNDGSKHRSVWLPASIAAKLGELLAAAVPSVNRTRISVGVNAVETLQPVAENASIRWRVGDHRIEIEGRTAGEVADALRVALGDGNDVDTLGELAEMLDCDPSELLSELRLVIERRDEAEGKVERVAAEAQAWHKRAEDLQGRPTTAQLQQAERAATKAQADLKALQVSITNDHNGIRELRRELLSLGLNGMSTAPLPDIAAAVARLGEENNNLRRVNSRGGMADDLQRQLRELQQEHEALQVVDEQLQQAIERERDLRKAAEQGRDQWIDRQRHEAEQLQAARNVLARAQADLNAQREKAGLLQEHLGIERRKVAELNGEVQRLTDNLTEADGSRTKAEEAYADCGRRNGELQGQLLAANDRVAKLRALLDVIKVAFDRVSKGSKIVALNSEQARGIVAEIDEALKA